MRKLSKYLKKIRDVRLIFFKRKWRKLNKNNFTDAKNIFPIENVKVGKYTYGEIEILTFGNDKNLIIGNYCSIAPEVKFLLSGEHNYKNISTFPFNAKLFGITESISKGDIIVKDDVWIGYGSVILSGVTIGQGAVIGAGSVVAKDVPPYAIYCGNKVIKYRFSEEIIKELLKIDFSKIDKDYVKNNINMFYEEITKDNIVEIIKTLSKKEKMIKKI